MAPQTLQPSALALVVVPAVFSTSIVGIRIWRRVIEKKIAVEDILLIIAQILIIVLTWTTWMSYKKSWYGYHSYDIPRGAINSVEVSKWGFANAVVYNPILGLIKASFVITLMRLRSPSQRINYSLWTIFTINALFTIAAPLVCAFQCTPVSKFWDKSKSGYCLDGPSYTYGTIAVVITTDIMVVVMPSWILSRLQMPLRRKLMIISFLSFGLAVTAIGGYRLWVFVQLYTKKVNSPDGSYGIRQGLSNVEVSLAAIGACGGTVKWMLGLYIPFFAGYDTPHPSKYGSPNGNGGRRENEARRGANSERMAVNDTIVSEEGDAVEAKPEQPSLVPVWKNTEYRSSRTRGFKTLKAPKSKLDVDKAANSRSDEQRFVSGVGITKTTE